MRVITAGLIIWLIGSSLVAPASGQDRFICQSNGSEIQQLRIYEINRGNREAFHDRFQRHALRIMQRYDFRIIDMWESDTGDKIQFVYFAERQAGQPRDG